MKNSALPKGALALVGVSGGADSLCLLHLLNRLGWPTCAAHFNHQLRPEADADARRVGEIVASWGIPFRVESGDVRAAAREGGESIEAAARRLRYESLFQTARQVGAGAVAVGHTADDQVETVLLHLLRGSGGSGLAGMRPVSQPNSWDPAIPLVRPLLACWRRQTEDYCAEHQIPYINDLSNTDPAFTRNRVRSELIPQMETFNPEVRQALWRLAEIQAGEQRVVEAAAAQAAQQCGMRLEGQAVRLERARLSHLPVGLQRAVIRAAFACLRPNLREVDFGMVERVRDYAAHPPRSGQADLAGGLMLDIRDDTLWIRPWKAVEDPALIWQAPQLSTGFIRTFEGETTIHLENGWILTGELLEGADLYAQAEINQDAYTAWLSLDSLQLPLQVRTRRAGDQIDPLGMGGQRVKVSDLMINERLPREVRAGWPLICQADGAIVWAPGLRAGESARVTDTTRAALRLTLRRPPPQSG